MSFYFLLFTIFPRLFIPSYRLNLNIICNYMLGRLYAYKNMFHIIFFLLFSC
ncbi:hypothetical protein HanIR_Chr09g0420571 [Helianthus annuus]|nr:hypothetical protein HanIR_Chr09g0420571 [Helianthus annuus]